jgi:hypothetical protein
VNAFSRQGFRHVLPGMYSPSNGSGTCCRGFSTVEVEQSHPPPMQAHEPSGLTWFSTFPLRFALQALHAPVRF